VNKCRVNQYIIAGYRECLIKLDKIVALIIFTANEF